jgi:hypothetical protein
LRESPGLIGGWTSSSAIVSIATFSITFEPNDRYNVSLESI